MKDLLRISYSYSFRDGKVKTFDISINRKELVFNRQDAGDPPAWADLNRNRCKICSLDEASNRYCPIALNLADIANQFKDYYSYEEVAVNVKTDDREYSKVTSIQEGLGSLVGIIMTTSGCPAMGKLKPMVRFHLPFATLMDTVYRTVSMYLLAQYYRNQEGKVPDWGLGELEGIYRDVGVVNRDFAVRLREAAKKDASLNALVNLDCFASMVPISAETILAEIKEDFSLFLNE